MKLLRMLAALLCLLPSLAFADGASLPPFPAAKLKAQPSQYLSYTAGGDSISANCCPTVPANSYVNRLATYLGLTASNVAVSGSMMQDTFPAIYPLVVSDTASQLFSLGIGTNEATFAGTAANRQLTFQAQHQVGLAWLALPSRSKVTGQTVPATVTISSLTAASASGGAGLAGIATATTAAAHGLTTGQGVTIAGATQAGYNITAPITVTSPTTFSYPLPSLPASPATASGSITATTTVGITYTGTWANDTANYGGAMSKVSSTNGSTATFKAFGPVVYLAYGLAPNDGGTFTVTVDGTSYGTFTSNGINGGSQTSPVVGVNHGSALARLSGLSNQTHTIVITVTSATGAGNVWLDWIGSPAGKSYLAGPTVLAMLPPRQGGVDTAQLYADLARADVGVLVGDGLNILAADVPGNLDPSTDLNPDNTHPNDAGHQRIFEAAVSALNTASSARAKSAYLAARSGEFDGGLLSGTRFGNYIRCYGAQGNSIAGGGALGRNRMDGCGNDNVIAGGYGNTIGLGGTNNTNGNFLGGGSQNIIQFGGNNFLGGGTLNVAWGNYNAVSGGRANSAKGVSSAIPGGEYADDRSRYGWQGFASGSFSAAAGTAQVGANVMRATATGTSAVRLTADGATVGSAANCYNIPDGTSTGIVVRLIARSVTTPGNRFRAIWNNAHELGRAGGTTTFDNGTGTIAPDSTKVIGAALSYTATVAADQMNNCAAIVFTPPSGNTDTWHVIAYVGGDEVQ